MIRQAILGIDVGTSACKAVLVCPAGKLVGSRTAPYPIMQPRPGWVEQDPNAWIVGAAKAVRGLLADHDDVVVRAVGLTGQMHGMTPLGTADEVLRPAILWNDQRGEAECSEAISSVGGEEAMRSYTNNDFLVGYTGSKILWLRNHEPDVFGRLRSVLNPKDYLRLVLTGEKATEVSDASGTGLLDVRNRKWSRSLMDQLGLNHSLFPKCYESPEVSGQVTTRGEELFGIPRGTPVVGGGGDSITQTVGSGIIRPGEIETNIGTGGVVAAALDSPIDNAGSGLQIFCNVIPGVWHAMGVTISAGFALNWLRRIFDGCGAGRQPWTFEEIGVCAAKSPVGAGGLLFLPYLNGERCPHPDPDVRGALVGLTGQHNSNDIARSVMEGIVFELYDIYRLLNSVGVTAHKLKASGGGAVSAFWRQLQADIFGMEVITTEGAAEGSAFGAALIAGLGVGLFSTPESLVSVCSELTRQSACRTDGVRMREMFSVYHGLYDALKESLRALSKMAA